MPPFGQQNNIITQLADALSGLGYGAKAGSASGTAVGPYLHGPDGLWSFAGVDRAVVSTRIRPRGIAGAIPARANNVMYPLFPYLTGFTDPVEVQANGPCDDPPTAGQMKNCLQTAQYGLYGYQSRELDIRRLGQIINRSENTDYTLMNNPLGGEGGNGIVWPESAGGSVSLANEVLQRMVEIGIKFQNKLMRQFWYGNPANNTGLGGYKEFPGMDRLIGTGKVDAITNTACPTLDSLVINMNYKRVDTLTGNDTVINVLTYALRKLRNTAERTGLAPVNFAIAMREGLFYELTAVWPCTYLTYRCAFPDTTTAKLNLDAGDIQTMRDSMRNEQYLIIDGTRYPVVLDDALDEETSGDVGVAKVPATCFASDIKILPMSVLGGAFSTLFWEYFDFSGPNAAMDAVSKLPGLSGWYWTDGGRYLWHQKTPINWCIQWLGSIQPRVVLRTPHLAANIQHIVYCPLMHERDAFPDDPYFLNGGNTSRSTTPSLWKSWS